MRRHCQSATQDTVQVKQTHRNKQKFFHDWVSVRTGACWLQFNRYIQFLTLIGPCQKLRLLLSKHNKNNNDVKNRNETKNTLHFELTWKACFSKKRKKKHVNTYMPLISKLKVKACVVSKSLQLVRALLSQIQIVLYVCTLRSAWRGCELQVCFVQIPSKLWMSPHWSKQCTAPSAALRSKHVCLCLECRNLSLSSMWHSWIITFSICTDLIQ